MDDNEVQDYLFDLQGHLVLKNAISAADLREMNQWTDDHESHVAGPWSTDGDSKKKVAGSVISKRIPTMKKMGSTSKASSRVALFLSA